MKKSISYLMMAVLALAFSSAVVAGEHPKEHPTSKKSGKEHSKEEHPKKGAKGSTSVTMEDLARSIEDYVEKDASLKGGYFLVYDAEAKKTLQLTLDKVHKERLSKVGEGVYFACADFKTPEGKVYDLDVFMKGTDADSLQVTEVSVHKEDGKARYGWVEKDGIWTKKK